MKETKIKGRLFEDTDNPKEKEAMLESNCLRSEKMPVKKNFTEDEMIEMRRNFSNQSIEIAKYMDELKKLKAEIMGMVKPLLENKNDLLSKIRNGFIENEETVFLFDFQEDGVMCYYDAKGELQHTRKLLPNERQHRILTMPQAANG